MSFTDKVLKANDQATLSTTLGTFEVAVLDELRTIRMLLQERSPFPSHPTPPHYPRTCGSCRGNQWAEIRGVEGHPELADVVCAHCRWDGWVQR